LATATLDGEDSTVELVSAYAVAAGSTLAVLGGVVRRDTFADVQLNSVSDTSSNTWQTPTNTELTFGPNAFFAYAMNVAAATPMVTLSVNEATSVRISVALVEITGVSTTGVLDQVVTGERTTAGTSTATDATTTLDQADNLLLGVCTGSFGVPVNPSGWTNILPVTNGGAQQGALICYKVISSTDAQTLTVAHESSSDTEILMAVFKQAAAGATLQYKLQLRTDTFTSADTGITAYVWRNSGPDGVFAEKYTGLAGHATAGDLIITGVPSGVALGDTITGVVYSAAGDTSGFITGTVEAA
jgi:hypothetical protein